MGLFNLFKKEKKTNNLEKRFYDEAKELFDEGILTEIFKCNSVSVCNVGNAYHAIFLLHPSDKNDIQFLLVNDEQIEFVFENIENVYHLYFARPKEQKMLYIFNDRAKTTMRNSCNRVKNEGGGVNLELEAELLKKYRARNELMCE